MTFASLNGAKACLATFCAIQVTVNGVASPAVGGTVTGTSTFNSGGSAPLTAVAASNYRFTSWSGAFTTGSGTVSGCTGNTASVTVSISGATDGAVYDCTASFQPQSVLTVSVVPAPSATSSFGLVSSPCTIAAGSSTCSVGVDSGTTVTLTTTEVKNTAGANISRFVKWVCSNGTSSAARVATTTISAATTCVAQYYGLWSRYYDVSSTSDDSFPNVAPLAPGVSAGLPTSSSTFLVDGKDFSVKAAGNAYSLAGLVAADDESGGPKYTDLASPELAGFTARTSSNGDDAPALIGFTYPTVNRFRGLFGTYQVSRDAAGVVNGLTRATFNEVYFPDPVGTTLTIDSAFISGRENASKAHAIGGYRSTTHPSLVALSYIVNEGWVVLTGAGGAVTASLTFQFDGSAGKCATGYAYMTGVSDIMWDTDPANPGGVVVVGNYADVATCAPSPAACPAAGGHTYGFIAKLSATLRLITMRGLAPITGQVAPSFTTGVVADNLASNGYVVFGQNTIVATSYVALAQLSYDLSTLSIQTSYAAADPNGVAGAAVTTLNDAVVDRVGKRYVILATAAHSTGNDVVIMSLDSTGAAIATDGWRFGSSAVGELGYRIIQPDEGGFLFTGYAPASVGGKVNSYWVTRTDETFNVPFNGAAPALQRSAPLAYTAPANLGLNGGVFTCATFTNATAPTQTTVTTTHTTFNPAENIQAP